MILKNVWFLLFHLNADMISHDIIYNYNINNIMTFWRHTPLVIRDTLVGTYGIESRCAQ